MSFFGEDDGAAEEGLRVNDSFAEKYHDRKRRQELAQAREAGLLDAQGEIVSDSESSSDEEEDAMPREEGLQVMHVLNMIRKKDPAIYKPDAVFFKKEESEEGSDDEAAAAQPDGDEAKTHKRKTVKDIVRDQVLAAAEAGKDDAFEDDEDVPVSKPSVYMGDKVYDEEQEALRAAVLEAGLPQEQDSDDDDFLQQSKQPSAAVAAAVDDAQVDEEVLQSAREWVGAVKRTAPQVDEDKLINLDVAGTGEMTEQAKDYLKWFTATRAWEGDAPEDDADSIDEDAEALDKADAFEATYNFRFEDPEGATIATHPRTTEASIRRKESKRKRQREAKAQRRAEEKAEREEEQKRLINLKREEEQKRMEKLLGEAGKGLDEARAAKVLAAMEAGEWDEETYDQLMTSAFGDEYYMEDEGDGEEGEGVVKPTAPAWMLAGDSDEEEGGDGGAAASAGGAASSAQAGHDSDEDSAVAGAAPEDDEDEEEGATAISTAQLAAQLSAASRRVVEAAVADVEADIGYEDVIAGGTIKTKFKYRSVPASDFGLETDTILRAPDKLLNTFVGLKKLAPYRDSEYSLTAKRAKKAREILQASIEEAEAAAEAAAKARKQARREARRAAAEGSSGKPKKKESRKARAKRAEEARGTKRSRGDGSDDEAVQAAAAAASSSEEEMQRKPSKKGGSMGSSTVLSEATSKGISKARLASYGAVVQDAVGKKTRRRSKKARKD